MVDARLPDGSRVNAIIPPLALDGALVSIRRFGTHPLQIHELVEKKSIPKEMVTFLAACVKARRDVGCRAPPGWRSNAYSGVASQQQDAIAEAPVTSPRAGASSR